MEAMRVLSQSSSRFLGPDHWGLVEGLVQS